MTVNKNGKYIYYADSKELSTNEKLQFFWNGGHRCSVVYVNGIKEGPYILQDKQGKRVCEGNFHKDERNGYWWLRKSPFYEFGRYKNGGRDGHWIFWDSHGRVSMEYKVIDFKLHGMDIHYYEGKKSWETLWDNGQEIWTKTY